MEKLYSKSLEELKEIRENLVKRYIGDFNKPIDYKQRLERIDKRISELSGM